MRLKSVRLRYVAKDDMKLGVSYPPRQLLFCYHAFFAVLSVREPEVYVIEEGLQQNVISGQKLESVVKK